MKDFHFDGLRVGAAGVWRGAVLRGKGGEVALVLGLAAEELVFAGGQIHAVKGGRGFLAAGCGGVLVKIDGGNFAAGHGEPVALGQIFACVQRGLGGLGEQRGDVVFETAVAVFVERERFALGVFEFQAA